jgi:hypothetical protein
MSRSLRVPGILIATGEEVDSVWKDLISALDGRGFLIWQADSGFEAFDLFINHAGEIDLLLIDTELSDLSPSAIFRRFRSHFPGLPCCFFTQNPTGYNAKSVRLMGAPVFDSSTSREQLLERLWNLAFFE